MPKNEVGLANHLMQALNEFLVVSGPKNYLSHAKWTFFLILSLDHFGSQAFIEDCYNE